MTRRAVVTGAAGFIGAHLVERLRRDGVVVVGIDNERSGDWSRLNVDCDRVHVDIVDLSEDDIAGLFRGADTLFHLAAEKYNSSKSTPQKVIDVNISATNRLFRGAADAGVRKVVFTSSLYAYGSMGPAPMAETDVPRPSTEYGVSKVAGEHLLRTLERALGLRWAVARLFFVYGPRQHAEGGYKSVILSNFERIRSGQQPIIHGDGEQALDYVFVDDVTRALVALSDEKQDGCIYNIGSGEAVTINALTAEMLRVAESRLQPVHGDIDWTAGSRRVAAAAAAALGLGWTPSTSLHDGLAQVWRWMEQNN